MAFGSAAADALAKALEVHAELTTMRERVKQVREDVERFKTSEQRERDRLEERVLNQLDRLEGRVREVERGTQELSGLTTSALGEAFKVVLTNSSSAGLPVLAHPDDSSKTEEVTQGALTGPVA